MCVYIYIDTLSARDDGHSIDICVDPFDISRVALGRFDSRLNRTARTFRDNEMIRALAVVKSFVSTSVRVTRVTSFIPKALVAKIA